MVRLRCERCLAGFDGDQGRQFIDWLNIHDHPACDIKFALALSPGGSAILHCDQESLHAGMHRDPRHQLLWNAT